MHEFKWETGPEGATQIDLRITRTSDGMVRCQNLKDTSQSYEAPTMDEALEGLRTLLSAGTEQ
jgi:hypothetical protein